MHSGTLSATKWFLFRARNAAHTLEECLVIFMVYIPANSFRCAQVFLVHRFLLSYRGARSVDYSVESQCACQNPCYSSLRCLLCFFRPDKLTFFNILTLSIDCMRGTTNPARGSAKKLSRFALWYGSRRCPVRTNFRSSFSTFSITTFSCCFGARPTWRSKL